MDVGIRELRARLSEYLKRVERGEIIGVTNQGRRIAQIVPVPGKVNVEQGLREGWVTRIEDGPLLPARKHPPKAGTPTTTDLIRLDRDA